MKQLFILITLIGIVFMSSCKKDEIEPTPIVEPTTFELAMKIHSGVSARVIISQEGHGNVVNKTYQNYIVADTFTLHRNVPAHIRVTLYYDTDYNNIRNCYVNCVVNKSSCYLWRKELTLNASGVFIEETLFEIDYYDLLIQS